MKPIITIMDTYIVLPSRRMLSLDAGRTFSPSREFWDLWRRRKAEVKRAGIGVRPDERTGEWRGYVKDASQGFSYSTQDLHAYWIARAKQKSESGERCDPVILSYDEIPHTLHHKIDCLCSGEFQVAVKVCRNDTYQLRLQCKTCHTKTSGAIAYDLLGADIVVDAIAHALTTEPTRETPNSDLAEPRGVNWV